LIQKSQKNLPDICVCRQSCHQQRLVPDSQDFNTLWGTEIGSPGTAVEDEEVRKSISEMKPKLD
jgi:hypothetical protein